MKLIINKIGKIKSAQIDVNGLTVIAGKNDTGKSTVGKLLYAIFRALDMGESFFNEMKKQILISNDILPLCRKYIGLSEGNKELRERIAWLLDENSSLLTRKLNRLENLSLPEIYELIQNIQKDMPSDAIDSIATIYKNISNIQHASLEEKMSYALERTLAVMFNGIVLNSKYHEDGKIVVNQNEKCVLEAIISEKYINTKYDSFLRKSLVGNIVYLESPFILENIRTRLKPHWEELKAVLFEKALPQDWQQESVNEELLNFIQTEIFGKAHISFEPRIKDFVYQVDGNATKLNMSNVACGVKSFAILFLLLKLNILKKDVLLAIDEPENHLHPEWQIKYAQLICLLVQKGFSIVLTSHSPTFIQALAHYINKGKLDEKVSFYLASQVELENYSEIQNVTKDLEKIYANLIAPTDRLYEFTEEEE